MATQTTQGMRVLLANGAKATLDLVVPGIESLGPKVTIVHTAIGESAVALATLSEFDLVVIETDGHDLAGIQVCAAIRKSSTVPIVALGGGDSIAAAVCAYECGADLYVSKPFHPCVLTARVKALLRRCQGTWQHTN